MGEKRLRQAAIKGDVQSIRYLLSASQDIIESTCKSGRTSLRHAAEAVCVSISLQWHADPAKRTDAIFGF